MIENDIKLLEHCVLDLQHRVQALEKKIKQTQRRIIVLECKADRKTEPQTDNGIGCSKCESRFWCMDRDMPHAVHCNNYGKTEPSTDCSWK